MTDQSNPQPATPATVPAGWYIHPHTNQRQWWDGTQWVAALPPAKSGGLRWWIALIGVIVAMILGISIGGAGKVPASDLIIAQQTIKQLRGELAAAPPADTAEGGTTSPAGDPITFSLEGDGNSAKVFMQGDYSLSWQTAGDCVYYADLEDGGGSLFSASAATSGSGFVYGLSGAEYYVQMITGPAPDCGWSVTFTPA
jgi:hypothetical protein